MRVIALTSLALALVASSMPLSARVDHDITFTGGLTGTENGKVHTPGSGSPSASISENGSLGSRSESGKVYVLGSGTSASGSENGSFGLSTVTDSEARRSTSSSAIGLVTDDPSQIIDDILSSDAATLTIPRSRGVVVFGVSGGAGAIDSVDKVIGDVAGQANGAGRLGQVVGATTGEASGAGSFVPREGSASTIPFNLADNPDAVARVMEAIDDDAGTLLPVT